MPQEAHQGEPQGSIQSMKWSRLSRKTGGHSQTRATNLHPKRQRKPRFLRGARSCVGFACLLPPASVCEFIAQCKFAASLGRSVPLTLTLLSVLPSHQRHRRACLFTKRRICFPSHHPTLLKSVTLQLPLHVAEQLNCAGMRVVSFPLGKDQVHQRQR